MEDSIDGTGTAYNGDDPASIFLSGEADLRNLIAERVELERKALSRRSAAISSADSNAEARQFILPEERVRLFQVRAEIANRIASMRRALLAFNEIDPLYKRVLAKRDAEGRPTSYSVQEISEKLEHSNLVAEVDDLIAEIIFDASNSEVRHD